MKIIYLINLAYSPMGKPGFDAAHYPHKRYMGTGTIIKDFQT